MTIIRIGLDTSKHVFQVHGVDQSEQPVLRRQVRRSEMAKFFANCQRRGSGRRPAGPRTTGPGYWAAWGLRWC